MSTPIKFKGQRTVNGEWVEDTQGWYEPEDMPTHDLEY